jgi:hypothetical protein
MPTPSGYVVIALVVLLIIGIIVAVSRAAKKHHVRQPWGYNQAGMGYYPPSIDPSAYGTTGGAVFSFAPRTAAASLGGKDLTAQWFSFAAQLDPNVREAIYSLFPDLQTEQSISYYGISNRMIETLKRIAPKLKNPASIRSMEDVNSIFAGDAVAQFSKDVNIRPQSGLYEDPKSYGNFIDVA